MKESTVLQAYCRSKNLPQELEHRGVKFIDSKHRSQQIIDARSTVQDMPPSLQDDIFWASESDTKRSLDFGDGRGTPR